MAQASTIIDILLSIDVLYCCWKSSFNVFAMRSRISVKDKFALLLEVMLFVSDKHWLYSISDRSRYVRLAS